MKKIEKNNEKTKCSLRGERGAVAKETPQQLLVSEIEAGYFYEEEAETGEIASGFRQFILFN